MENNKEQEAQELERITKKVKESSLFRCMPQDIKSLYIHVSSRFYDNSHLVEGLKNYFGKDNALVTYAPHESGQSFYHFRDEIEDQKRKKLNDPVIEFSKQKSIDTIIYLCHYLCDGYQSPIFPEDVVTTYHIWHAIKLAEEIKKPLIVGYQNPFCFGVECYERKYITNPKEIKCEAKVVRCF